MGFNWILKCLFSLPYIYGDRAYEFWNKQFQNFRLEVKWELSFAPQSSPLLCTMSDPSSNDYSGCLGLGAIIIIYVVLALVIINKITKLNIKLPFHSSSDPIILYYKLTWIIETSLYDTSFMSQLNFVFISYI